jgi:DNA helicase II / ATP-dependent DNA helicase PcrA
MEQGTDPHLDRNAAFRAYVDTLNPEQREAVEHIEGPVLVLAGPGTGKTQVLTTRIGNILLRTDARPQNILCLTFTDAATHAMRERLLALIGPDAHRVPIMTYHSFCSRVIQEHPEYFSHTDLQPATELERIQIVRDLLDALPVDHPLRDGYKSPYQLERQIRHLFSLMKTEHWRPGHVLRQIEIWERQLPENQLFIFQRNSKHGKKGEPRTDNVNAELARMQRIRAAADLYPRYVQAMLRAGRYEFDDMLLWVLREFEQHPELLRLYQERYLYMLVDEYQDTNGAQNRLLQQLADYWEVPNIFIVGDDDQSIYEFQGARLQNLLDYYQQYQNHLLTVVLTANYRSSQALLDAARRIIEHNTLRAAQRFDPPVNKRLHAALDAPDTSVSIHVYEHRMAETTAIVRHIEQLIGAGTAPNQIAVIYARHQQAAQLTRLMTKSGIPFLTKRPANLLDEPIIKQVLEVLYYAHESLESGPMAGEWRLFRLLHAPFWGIGAQELAHLAVRLARSGSPDMPASWRAELAQSAWPRAQWLADLPAMANWMSLTELIEHVCTRSGLLTWVLDQPDRVWLLEVLSTFRQYVTQETQRAGQPLQLAQLLAQIETLQSNKIPIAVQQHWDTGGSEAGSVHLLTAHSAKGLEFGHVFLMDCTADAWEASKGAQNIKFKLPPTLTHSGEEDAEEARRRLFYVAVTRAKRHLYASVARVDEAGKRLEQSRFLEELDVEMSRIEVPADDVMVAAARLIGEATAPVIQLTDLALTNELLRDYVLSINGLNRYLRCPLAFYYEDILRVPGAPTESAIYGKAVHGALQAHFMSMQKDAQRQWPEPEALATQFEIRMRAQRGHFNVQNYTQRLALGRAALVRYAHAQVPLWRKRARAEWTVHRVILPGDILIKGVVDRVEFLDGGAARVVDYKTGTPDRKKVAAPTPDNPQGGAYWRQLAFYKVLLEASNLLGESVGQGVISWVEPNKKGVFEYQEVTFGPSDMRMMEALIADVWAKIQSRTFAPGCGQPDCMWCQLHQVGVGAYRDRPEEEELDEG